MQHHTHNTDLILNHACICQKDMILGINHLLGLSKNNLLMIYPNTSDKIKPMAV